METSNSSATTLYTTTANASSTTQSIEPTTSLTTEDQFTEEMQESTSAKLKTIDGYQVSTITLGVFLALAILGIVLLGLYILWRRRNGGQKSADSNRTSNEYSSEPTKEERKPANMGAANQSFQLNDETRDKPGIAATLPNQPTQKHSDLTGAPRIHQHMPLPTKSEIGGSATQLSTGRPVDEGSYVKEGKVESGSRKKNTQGQRNEGNEYAESQEIYENTPGATTYPPEPTENYMCMDGSNTGAKTATPGQEEDDPQDVYDDVDDVDETANSRSPERKLQENPSEPDEDIYVGPDTEEAEYVNQAEMGVNDPEENYEVPLPK